MALDQQENNLNYDDLITLLQPEYARLQYNINVKNNVDNIWGISGPISTYVGQPTVTLDLLYYIDQSLLTPPKDIYMDLENHIQKFISKVDGSFIQRMVEPYRSEKCTTVKYQIRLHDYDKFLNLVTELSRKKAYEQFTKALESKLLED